jgi:hypothetical protein
MKFRCPIIALATLFLMPCTPLSATERGAGLRFVLLADQAVVAGTVREEADRIVIEQPGSVEIRLPRSRVACWADSLQGLYQFQLDQRQKNSLEQHWELARWCIRNRYFAGAAHEISAANRLAPDHQETARLEVQLRKELEAQVTTNASRPSDQVATEQNAEQNTEQNAESPNSMNQMTEHELKLFSQTIQPLLTNSCGTRACHGGPGVAFQIELPAAGMSRQNSVQTQHNLRETLRWLDNSQPSSSPLLVRAQEAHGGLLKAPLNERHRQGMQSLQRWAEAVAGGQNAQPQLDTNELAAVATSSTNSQTEATGLINSPSRPPGTTIRLPAVPDPFDPELFNRRFHRE